jgi:hypothetical protein
MGSRYLVDVRDNQPLNALGQRSGVFRPTDAWGLPRPAPGGQVCSTMAQHAVVTGGWSGHWRSRSDVLRGPHLNGRVVDAHELSQPTELFGRQRWRLGQSNGRPRPLTVRIGLSAGACSSPCSITSTPTLTPDGPRWPTPPTGAFGRGKVTLRPKNFRPDTLVQVLLQPADPWLRAHPGSGFRIQQVSGYHDDVTVTPPVVTCAFTGTSRAHRRRGPRRTPSRNTSSPYVTSSTELCAAKGLKTKIGRRLLVSRCTLCRP